MTSKSYQTRYRLLNNGNISDETFFTLAHSNKPSDASNSTASSTQEINEEQNNYSILKNPFVLAIKQLDWDVYLAPNHSINLLYAIWIVMVFACAISYILICPIPYDPKAQISAIVKCNFKGQYYRLTDYVTNISILVEKNNANYSSKTFSGTFTLIKNYLHKIEKNKSTHPVIISILSSRKKQNYTFLQAVQLIKTFSRAYSVIHGNAFKKENDRSKFEAAIIDSFTSRPSKPIIIRYLGKIHPIFCSNAGSCVFTADWVNKTRGDPCLQKLNGLSHETSNQPSSLKATIQL
ncbi:hypothetical protein HZS_164, partial [Henneguya salminicola]